ncbi:MAG: hypothetical protein ACAI25_05510 [Planctomycetota bacterium]
MTTLRDELGSLVANVLVGLETSAPKGLRSLMVGNTVFSIAELTDAVKKHHLVWQRAEDLNAELHAAVQIRDSQAPIVRDFMTDVKHAIVAALGSRNPELLKFGIEPKRNRKKMTGEEQVRANAKRRATMGAKEIFLRAAGDSAPPSANPEKRTA